MRVVHVATNTMAADMLGLEKYTLNLAVAQKASGSDVMIMTNRLGWLSEACQQHDIPVVAERSLAELSIGESIPVLVSQFSSSGADVIHCHTPSAAARAIPAGNQLGIPCVFTFHVRGNNGRFDGGNAVTRARSSGLRFATICVSKINFEDMKKHGIPEAELYYVPHGTEPASHEHTPEVHESHRQNLIFVGGMEQVKGIDLAILAMVELRRRRGSDCPALNIYGNGNDELDEYYREIVTVLQLDDIVRFCGFQSNILDTCPDSDILLMASRSESGPLVVLEAMSRGMPIVASEVGSVREMLPDRRYGRIIPVNSIVPLVDAVESLLDDISAGLFDPSLIIERHRSLFTTQKMADRVEAVYKQVLEANTASR